MYHVGQEIEYANGLEAQVVWVGDEGYFVIKNYDSNHKACLYDLSIDEEEVWSFEDECGVGYSRLEDCLWAELKVYLDY